MTNVPFSPPYITEEMIAAVSDVLRSGWITTGPKTAEFENKLAQFIQAKSVVALNSATAGLELALRWFGIGPGDEVIIPAYTYCATGNVVLHCGAKVIFADSGPDFNMAPKLLKPLINENTKAIIPVDFGGFPCNYDSIRSIVEAARPLFKPNTPQQHQLGRILLLADAAHSLGALYKGKPASVNADFSAFSFHAVKNLTTAEGGALAVNLPDGFDELVVQKELKCWSLHGQSKDALSKTQAGAWKYDVAFPGYKCNMTDIQAVLGLEQLRIYPEILEKRRAIFQSYSEAFQDQELPLYETTEAISSYHVFALRLKGKTEEQRNALIRYAGEQGVALNVHFQPLPLLTAYKERGYSCEEVPQAFALYSNEVSLPVFAAMTEEQVNRVIEVVQNGIKQL